MRIAMMVRAFIPVPRPSEMIYAPIDLASEIAAGLAARGHQIDFYAPMGSSITGVNIVSCNLRAMAPTNEDFREIIEDPAKMTHYAPALWDSYMVNRMFRRARSGQYELLHFHHPESALAMAEVYRDVPVVYTLHDPAQSWLKELYELYQSNNQFYVSISNNQRRSAPDLPYLATVYNGIDPRDYPFNANPENYLLYAGRIAPEKGVKEAISVAKQTHNRLLIIGPVYPDTQGYFDQYIKPELNNQILYLGFLERDKLPVYYQKAKAVLTPVQWEEPFGLTTIEALASGTPVISFRRGAAPEIIEDGKSGFVVNTTAEMVTAVKRVGQIKRENCRKRVTRHFSVKKMVDGYEDAFGKAIALQRRRRPTSLVTKNLRRVPGALIDASRKSKLPKIKS